MWIFWVTVCLLIVQSFSLSIRQKKGHNGEKDLISSKSEVCDTAGCAYAAVNLLNAMNQSVDPCQDFFTYACGGWIDKNPIPDDKSKYNVFTSVRQRVIKQLKGLLQEDNEEDQGPIAMTKQLYRTCMDRRKRTEWNSQQLFDDIQLLGSMPMLMGQEWQWTGQDFTCSLGRVLKHHSISPFFRLYAAADAKNTTRVVLYLDQTSNTLGYSTRDYYLDPKHVKVITALKRMIKSTIESIALDNDISVTEEDIDADIEDLINFDTKLAKILTPEADRRNGSLLYNPRKIKDLEDIVNFIKWDDFWDIVLPEDVLNHISEDTDIIIRQREFFPKLKELIDNTDHRTLANFVFWKILFHNLLHLDEKYEDIYQDFSKVYSGRPEKPSLWEDCAGSAQSNLGQATGALYTKKYFDISERNEANIMIEFLRETFTDMLQSLDWMDNTTKSLAEEKAAYIMPMVGFPDMAIDPELLQEFYKDLKFNHNDSYYEILRKSEVWNMNRGLRKLLKPFDRTEWFTSPSVVNAFYSSKMNSITFPAGILQDPFFSGHFPKSVNYGGIGFVIGHEITHGFDDQGRQYDAIGNLKDWWEAATSEEYEKKAKCFIDQYINIEVAGTGLKAYRRYIDSIGKEEPRLPGLTHLTGNQIFFLSAAQFWCGESRQAKLVQQVLMDPHSPAVARVNVPMSNLVQFGETFQCHCGAPMNPCTKCSVW